MPLWRIYHPETAYTEEEKQAFAQSITKIYTDVGLPAFYVNVFFFPMATHNIFIGGRTTDPSHPLSAALPGSSGMAPFVRIYGSNIARKMQNSNHKRGFLHRVDEAIKPWVQDKGYDWEYHFDETDRELWRIQGLIAPEQGSEEERLWIEQGKPVLLEKL